MPRATLRPLLAAALLAAAAASPAGAQHAAPPLAALRPDGPGPLSSPYAPALQESGPYVPTGTLAFGGILGGAAGFAGGALLGYTLDTALADCKGEEWCGFRGVLLGGALGEALMLPLGVHLANRSRGRYAPGAAMSILVGLGGLTLAAAAGEGLPLVVPAIPVAQLLTAVRVERSTAARRLRGED
ncbi:MAG TPA: hypothetical protein VF615_16995 [Longimicrobiaceae bacterium]|jgi:hypothetical protein